MSSASGSVAETLLLSVNTVGSEAIGHRLGSKMRRDSTSDGRGRTRNLVPVSAASSRAAGAEMVVAGPYGEPVPYDDLR